MLAVMALVVGVFATAQAHAGGGKVKVLYMPSDWTELQLNGGTAGKVQGPDGNQSVQVDRVLNQSDAFGRFANGYNTVGFVSEGSRYSLQLRIDGNQSPLSQDLTLVIYKNFWVLSNPSGVMLDTGPIQTSWEK